MIVLSRISMVSLRTDVTLIRCKFIRDSFTRIFNTRMSGIFYLFLFVVSVSDRGDDRKSFMFEVSKRKLTVLVHPQIIQVFIYLWGNEMFKGVQNVNDILRSIKYVQDIIESYSCYIIERTKFFTEISFSQLC